ncbi:helix-turn-helix domain-containing protein [uncultured Holdemanella sp.]|uniref:helix-turn-helix domain-containing protein n=1 Tax=uncultured Holdemanella sp. TaxID=1763549 RepID=UPI00258BDF7E|nr:helix-turn-helix domain-containing protein [uncultured Holdemanella sp.]
MLQKELSKRLRARYDTKMDGSGWLEVSSDGIPLCRIKYNGQYLSNADQNLSVEYRSKIADIQDEISTVREYVGLYEHAPQSIKQGNAEMNDTLKEYPDVLSVRETSKILRIGINKTYGLINSGALSSIKIGGKIIVPKICLMQFLSDTKNYQANPK